MSVEGVDLSNWNSVLPDLSPFAFVFHKATQGDYFTDVYYERRHALVRGQGKVWGAYLFPEPRATVRAQLDHFANVADIQTGDVVALDFEDYSGVWASYGRSLIGRMGADLMNGLRRFYPNNRVVLYCNISTYRDIVVPFGVPVMDGLWIAAPDQTPGMEWVFWQYTSVPVDTNRSVFATVDELHEWAGMEDVVASAEDIVKAFMEYRIKGVRVGPQKDDGTYDTWDTSVENAIGSVWGQVFNATGEYGPSLAGGLGAVQDELDDLRIVQERHNAATGMEAVLTSIARALELIAGRLEGK